MNYLRSAASEVGILVCILSFLAAVEAEFLFKELDAEVVFHDIGTAPREELVALPVLDRNRLCRLRTHRNASVLDLPYFVGSSDAHYL